MKTTAIIVAAGSGSRFNSDIPKQFLELSGRPLITQTILRFVHARHVAAGIIVVVGREWLDFFGDAPYGRPFQIVEGGATRAESVFNGLKAVNPETEIVAVHDGARPLVSSNDIDRTIARAKETGAACLVAPVTDTVKTVCDGEITGTLDRNKLCRALTPQVFKVELLRQAFELAELSDTVTDECYLVEQLGHPIATVEATTPNIKVTTADDLLVVAALYDEFLKSEFRLEQEDVTRRAYELKSKS